MENSVNVPKEHDEKLNPLAAAPSLNTLSASSPYTIPEAAVILRMSEKSVRRQIDRGNLRRCAVFGRVLIPRKDVETFFERTSSAFAA